jgi:hypothetical protein
MNITCVGGPSDGRRFRVADETIIRWVSTPNGRVRYADSGKVDPATGDTVFVPKPQPHRFPMTREMLGEIKTGRQVEACVLVRAPGRLEVGDKVMLREAVFDQHDIATFVPGGKSLHVTLTRAEAQSEIPRQSTIFFIAWDAVLAY